MVHLQGWLKEFIDATEEELAVIDTNTETTSIKANELLLKQGEVSERIGLLLQGAVRTYFTDMQGIDKTVAFVFEGEPMAVIDSFFQQMPSSVSCVTIEPSVIVWTDYARFTAIVHKFPKYNNFMLSAVSRWFAEGKNRMEYLHQSSAKAKYETMCKLHPKINQRVPLKYIASYLGITQETLSRIRGKR